MYISIKISSDIIAFTSDVKTEQSWVQAKSGLHGVFEFNLGLYEKLLNKKGRKRRIAAY